MSRLKLVVVLATLIWGALVVYLLSNAEEFNKYRGRLNEGVKWAGQFLPTDIISANAVNSSAPKKQPLVSQINIVMQSDEQDLGGLVTAAYSVTNNSKANIHFHFIVPENTKKHLEMWLQYPQLSHVIYSVKTLPEELENDRSIGKVIFTDLFPELEGPVIYLDSDLIVQGNIQELLNLEIPDNSIGLFSDDCHSGSTSKSKSSRGENRYGKRIQLKNSAVIDFQNRIGVHINVMACTFSTGVFVVSDTKKWKNEISNEALKLIKTHYNESIIGTQGGTDKVEAALLVVLYGRTAPLDPLWHVRQLGLNPANSMYSSKYLTDAKLIHWSGYFKPWSRRAPERNLWDRYFAEVQSDPLGKFKPVRKSL